MPGNAGVGPAYSKPGNFRVRFNFAFFCDQQKFAKLKLREIQNLTEIKMLN
jgi:hypothetical protein